MSSNQVVYFALNYPYPGLGMAKIFFDLPSTDTGDQANDPYLAGQIYFAIDPATGYRHTVGDRAHLGHQDASPTALIPVQARATVAAPRRRQRRKHASD